MALTVDCPQCARKSEFSESNRWRPFCSERCRQIDLGVWASGGYSIPGETIDPQADADGLGPTEARPPRRS